MVAGKVKLAMGFQKSPSQSNPNPNPKPKSPTSSEKSTRQPSPASSGKRAVFSRSFGVHFPSRSSAQVQPRPPPPDLLRLLEDLREREHLLQTELLEFKLIRETAAIVPFLEKQISEKSAHLQDALRRIESLEEENEKLRNTLFRERETFEKKVKELEAEVSELKKTTLDRENEELVFSSSQKCSLVRNYLNGANHAKRGAINTNNNNSNYNNNNKYCFEVKEAEDSKREEAAEKPRHVRCNSEEFATESLSLTHHQHDIVRSRAPRVPKPPPKRSSSSPSLSSSSSSLSSSSSSSDTSDQAVSASPPPPPPPLPPRAASPTEVKKIVPPPPPPPPPLRRTAASAALKNIVPPPPPPPPKAVRISEVKVRRVPEVVEFYHSLMRRDSRRDSGGSGATEAVPATANARDMIGEIENRSAHLLAIKTDVETQAEFIRYLIKEVEDAAFTDIEDVVPFVKWLDDELSYLVDERAVLKHFEWPEQKADALREASFGYRDLKKLEFEAASFCDDTRQPCGPALKKMQALLEKLEHGVYNLSRMRESATHRYKGFQIPMDWMLETGIVNQIKLATVKLAMKYMKRVSAELEVVGGGPEEEELIVQGVRFAFRVHQFAGGFDVETMRAFQELRDKAKSCHVQCQNQQQQKFLCKSTAC